MDKRSKKEMESELNGVLARRLHDEFDATCSEFVNTDAFVQQFKSKLESQTDRQQLPQEHCCEAAQRRTHKHLSWTILCGSLATAIFVMVTLVALHQQGTSVSSRNVSPHQFSDPREVAQKIVADSQTTLSPDDANAGLRIIDAGLGQVFSFVSVKPTSIGKLTDVVSNRAVLTIPNDSEFDSHKQRYEPRVVGNEKGERRHVVAKITANVLGLK